MKKIIYCFFFGTLLFSTSCSNNDDNSDLSSEDRNFKMGFTTWSFGPTPQDVDDTYAFIASNSDIYAEHIDNKIPWNAWINDLALPQEFTSEIESRINKRLFNQELLLSVSLLNSNRDQLAEDFDGTVPNYTNLNDIDIVEAYTKHIDYLVNQFDPDYLVIAIEVNELRIRAENKWEDYKSLIHDVKTNIKESYPNLPISESITLHNLYEPDITNPEVYINEIMSYMNQMDFVSISFYPFFKNLKTREEFQKVFDFLHNNIQKPIAIVETSHIAEDLIVPNLNVSINGNQVEQNVYLETLLTNAEEQDYSFIIWWAHKDYDALWQTFPQEVQDIGKLWRDTGLINEVGNERLSLTTWSTIYEN